MSRHNDQAHPPVATIEAPHPRDAGLPKWLYAAFAIVLLGGAAIYAARDPWIASSIYSNIGDSAAGLAKTGSRNDEQDVNDGLDDAYGVVVFQTHPASVARLLSECETNPRLALGVFRRCMDEGNKNAKLIGLNAIFYLVPANVLDKGDIERVASRLDSARENDAEVRKAAQRALSELILIKDAATRPKYAALPAEIGKSEGDWPSNRIEMHEEESAGHKQLRIRWSNPDTALAWWKLHGNEGAWSPADHAWVLP